MRILVENSGYHLRNLGDVAMLQGAVSRIKSLMADAQLQIVCSDPERLQRLIPGTEPVSNHLTQRALVERMSHVPYRLLPRFLRSRIRERDRYLRVAHPQRLASRLCRSPHPDSAHWLDLLKGADAVIATGGGFLTDSFEEHALSVLTSLSLAQYLHKPTALLGQGLGPIEHAALRKAVTRILGKADLLTLREAVLGPTLLQQMDLQSHPGVCVAGDDALEIIPVRMAPQKGLRMGITVRLSSYAGVNDSALEMLSTELQNLRVESAGNFEFCPLPIDLLHPGSNDETAAYSLLKALPITSDYQTPSDPSDVVDLAFTCSVTLSGSYHSALFSIAQGVPVIAVQGSAYYAGKFAGLEAMFPGSIQVFNVNQAQPGDLQRCLDQVLAIPDSVRCTWVERGSHFRELGRAHYGRFFASLHSRFESDLT